MTTATAHVDCCAAAGLTPRPVVMHVLHTLNLAGAEVLVRDMIDDLRGQYRFIVVSLDSDGALGEQLRQLGAEVHVLNRRPGFDFSCARRIARLMRKNNVDIVHAHQYTPFLYAAIARLISGNAKLIFTEHGRHYPDDVSLKRKLINHVFLGRLAHRITAVGRFVRQALVRNEWLPMRRIKVIHNGIRPDLFTPNAQTRKRMRESLDLDDNQPVICHVGGFRPVKDHRTAIHALRQLHLMGTPATLLLVGDGPCLEATRAEATICRVEDHVRFLGQRDDVADLWQAADVALLSSLSEGISVALLEAMATSVPVVATDVGGNREIVASEVTGLLAPRGDAAGLAMQLQTLLQNNDLRLRYGSASRERVIERFNKHTMHQAYARMYEELTNAMATATACVR